MPTRRIQGPEGPIDFPGEMNDIQIEQAMQKLYPPHKGPELQLPALRRAQETPYPSKPLGPIPGALGKTPEPSWYSKMADSVAGPESVIRKGHEGFDALSALASATDTGEIAARLASTTLGGPVNIERGATQALAARELNPTRPDKPLVEGLAKAGGGAFETLTPLIGAGAVSRPLLTAAGLIGAGVGSEIGERGSKALGASPEYQQLFGLLGAGAGGFATGGLEGWREYKSKRIEDLFEQHVKAGMDPAGARAAAEQGHANYAATGNAKFLDPYNQTPTVGELEKGSIKGPAKVVAQQTASAVQGAASGALMQGEKPSSQETGLTTKDLGLVPERPKSVRPSPIPQPGPGSTEYEALKAKVAKLDRPFTSVEEAGRPVVEQKPDYLKRKLSLTRTGETYVDRQAPPPPDEMARRSFERYTDATQAARKLERAGADPARVEQVKGEALRHLTTWGQYATPEQFKTTLTNIETPLRQNFEDFKLVQHEVGRQLEQSTLDAAKLQDPTLDIANVPSRFAAPTVEGTKRLLEIVREHQGGSQKTVSQISRNERTGNLRGAKVLSTLALDLQDKVLEQAKVAGALLKGKQGTSQLLQEIDDARTSPILKLGQVGKKVYESPVAKAPEDTVVAAGAAPAEPKAVKDTLFNYSKTATKAGNKEYGPGKFRVIEKAGKFRVEPITAAPEVSAKPEVGRTAEPSTETPTRPEPVQASEAPEGSREPVPAAKGSEVEELERMSRLEHPLQKLEGSLRASDPSAQATINRDLERRGINPPGPSQGRRSTDPVTGEEIKSTDALIGQRLGPDSVFESRVQQMMKKALGQGKPITRSFAERTVREDMEGERGRLSFRRINPGPGSVSSAGPNILSSLAKFLTTSPEEQTARNVMRSVFGERSRAIDQLYTKFNEAIRDHEGDSANDLIRFNNAAERKPGSSFLSPQDQALADSFQDIYQNILWPTLQQINPDKFKGAGIENYMGRLFKGKNSAAKVEQVIQARRPFEGGKKFANHRIYQWIDESIAAGAEPLTNNPIKMQTLVMNQIVKYISAHKAFENLKDRGLIEWTKVGGDRQPGWTAIDDSIFHPRVPMEGGLMEYGKYYAHPDVAKVFNRWLKPGLRGNALYDPLRNFADTQNMIQLGFSGFHFTFTSVAGAATSDVALGLQQVFNYGKPIKGLVSIAKGMTILPSMYDTYHLGTMMREEWTVPGTHPWLSKYADAVEDVGGGIGSTTLLSNRQRVEKFKSMWGDGSYNKVRAVLQRGLPALAEYSSRKLMEQYVPNVKLGVFAKMAFDHYDSLLDKGASQDEIRTAIGKDWDSVDNRMGQVRYDNRFWNKSARDIAQITIRSVGWNWGTIGEVFGGGADVGKLIAQAGQKALGVRPERLELSSKAAYFMAMPAIIAGLGALMHYGLTGKAPEKLEDYIYPGPEGGKISLPTYGRDVFSTLKHAPTTFLNKLHPMWAQLYATVFANEDFYHVEIRHPGDSPMQQAAELGKFLLQSNAPISWQSAYSRAHQEQNWPKAVALSELGFTAAPKWVGQTKAQELIFELSKRKWEQGPRTTAEYQKRQTMFKLRDALKTRKLTNDMIGEALKSRTINIDDVVKLTTEDPMEPYQREFKGLDNLNDQINVLKRATPEEKAALKPLINFDKLQTMPLDEAQMANKTLRKLLQE